MRSITFLFSAALLLTPIVAGAPALAQSGQGRHEGGKLGRFFTPEQRAMYKMGARDQVRDMTQDQRHAFRHEQIAKVMAMPEPERARLKADLQARWDALPQARKDRIEQRIAARDQRQQLTPQDLNPGQAR
jgi:hypothetical protein